MENYVGAEDEVLTDQDPLPDKEMPRDEAVSMDARAHATLPRYTQSTGWVYTRHEGQVHFGLLQALS